LTIDKVIKELKLQLQGLSKSELSAIIVYLADHSFGLREVYQRQYGSNFKAEFESRIGASLTRSKKGMLEEIDHIIMAFPAAALWLKRQFFGLSDEQLRKIAGDAVPVVLGGKLEPDFRANQLWFFLDVLYQQGAAENFEFAVTMGSGLYFYVLSQWGKYKMADASRFEALMQDFFDGLGYQLKEDKAQSEKLYQHVVDQLEKNRHVYKLVDTKKIKGLARSIKSA